ncbi:hypothetical protein [Microbacterium natoriense]|nr:hypothetical protein [Microbacterium natoriense]
MTVDAIVSAAFGALLGGAVAFFGGYIQRRLADRRAIRSMIYTTYLRDALKEVERYDKRPYRSGELAYLRTARLSAALKEVHRQALVASRGDEFQTRSLWRAAIDLDATHRRVESDEHISRAREGGWGKLMYDTVAQAKRVLLDYEGWLHRRLLTGPRRRHPGNYERLEIDRDAQDPDSSRFDQPDMLTAEALERLIECRPVSWRLRTDVPIYGLVVDVWVREDEAQRTG